MTLEGFSGFCAKLDPASSKNNEILILEINILHKSSHALLIDFSIGMGHICLLCFQALFSLGSHSLVVNIKVLMVLP